MVSNSEVEASRFARVVEEIEKQIREGGDLRPGYSLASLLQSNQGRLDSIRAEDEQLLTQKKEKDEKDRSAVAAMFERETKLNEEEKKKYAEFLSKDYFTRSDLGDLSRFYADGGAYDRLSDDGKEQMDTRVKEGVERGELSRDELPQQIESKVYRSEQSQERSRKSEVDATTASLSADERGKAVSKSASEITTGEPSDEASASKEKPKADLPEGLGGLASLSPVQETSGVVVPQTGSKGGSREIGG